MHQVPETRSSLILRLVDEADHDAWEEFASIYEPFIYRYARRHGVQDADAREIVQDVFVGVSKAVAKWEPDRDRAKFRTWLFRIAKYQLLRRFRTTSQEQQLGDYYWSELDDAISLQDWKPSEEEEIQYRRMVFRWAANQVKQEVKPKTWLAFQLSRIEDKSISEVSTTTGMTKDQVYVARSRVIKRLREHIRTFEANGGAVDGF